MKRKRVIMGIGARLCLLVGLVAGFLAYNQFPYLRRFMGIEGAVVLPTFGASVGYLIGRFADPPKRDPEDLLEETFK